MQVEQFLWTTEGWASTPNYETGKGPQLVFAFGDRHLLESEQAYNELRKCFPNAQIALSSTSGQIHGTEVVDKELVVSALRFEKTQINVAQASIFETPDAEQLGQKLCDLLPHEGLRHVIVLSDGQHINGSALVRGIVRSLPEGINVTGGLAGDGDRFEKTLVGLNATPKEGAVLAIGLYGNSLSVGYGSLGGWEPFGPVRQVTRSENNVLYELDGRSALDLYKEYLGDQAKGLPGTALRFPLALQKTKDSEPVVRTILAVDEDTHSMTFAGEMPTGSRVQLMRASYDNLIQGATKAAASSQQYGVTNPQFVICVSCVGRRIVLGQRTEEEVEEVQGVLGDQARITGFYSYGEIAPFSKAEHSQLHNQTMTITTLSEV